MTKAKIIAAGAILAGVVIFGMGDGFQGGGGGSGGGATNGIQMYGGFGTNTTLVNPTINNAASISGNGAGMTNVPAANLNTNGLPVAYGNYVMTVNNGSFGKAPIYTNTIFLATNSGPAVTNVVTGNSSAVFFDFLESGPGGNQDASLQTNMAATNLNWYAVNSDAAVSMLGLDASGKPTTNSISSGGGGGSTSSYSWMAFPLNGATVGSGSSLIGQVGTIRTSSFNLISLAYTTNITIAGLSFQVAASTVYTNSIFLTIATNGVSIGGYSLWFNPNNTNWSDTTYNSCATNFTPFTIVASPSNPIYILAGISNAQSTTLSGVYGGVNIRYTSQ